MRAPILLLLTALSSFAAVPEPPDVCERLRTARVLLPLAEQEQAAGRIAAELVADALHELRGPRPDGSYRWARLSEKAAVEVSKGVEVDRSRLEWRIEGSNWFALRLKCPKKKNLFWGNDPVMVRSVLLDGGGHPRILEKDRLLGRDEKIRLDFGAILPTATVTIVFEKVPGSERDPFIEVAGIQAGLWDDPANPRAEMVGRLLDLADERPGGDWYASRLDRVLEGCRQPVRRELEYILYLLNGTPREQEEARRRLEAIIREL